MRKRPKYSLTHKILKAIAIGGVVAIAATNPYFGLAFMKSIRKDLERKKWREFYLQLKKLQKTKRINAEQNPDGSFNVTITQLGKDYVAKYDLHNLEIKKPEFWDGLWRLCSFDIPTKKKVARYALIDKLKELGFIMVQKSLWAHPFECREELAVVGRAFNTEPYMYCFLGSDFDGHQNNYLKIKFEKKNKIFLKT